MERPLDPARLGDHLDRFYRPAWALCGFREDAADLVQETYARVPALNVPIGTSTPAPLRSHTS
jgi:DNA-directed RNA polymerase specialized sigma24 family protein